MISITKEKMRVIESNFKTVCLTHPNILISKLKPSFQKSGILNKSHISYQLIIYNQIW